MKFLVVIILVQSFLFYSVKAESDEIVELEIPKYIKRYEEENGPRSRDHWKKKVKDLKMGMTYEEVMTILEPSGVFYTSVITGGGHCDRFDLDKYWSFSICYQDNSEEGKSKENSKQNDTVVSIGSIVKGGWGALPENWNFNIEQGDGGDA